MKKLLFLSFISIFLIFGCSKTNDENITISCIGDKVIRKKNGVLWEHVKNVKHNREYIFVNKQLHPYECSWSDRSITCLSNKSISKEMSVVIVIDREKGEVWESFTIYQVDGSGTNDIFTGKCEKLEKKF